MEPGATEPANEQSNEQLALLLSGALGGPFTIWFYTPLRNAITLGSKFPQTAPELYRMTFAQGIRGGWTGAIAPTFFSSGQVS